MGEKQCTDETQYVAGWEYLQGQAHWSQEEHNKRGVCPFEWMELISLQGKTNFFKTPVGEYSSEYDKLNHDGQNELSTVGYYGTPKSMWQGLGIGDEGV